MKSYSYGKADLFLWNYIRKHRLAFPHYAVEFGALDGKQNSNIRLFLEQGWQGLWIEPSRENYAELEKNIEGLDVEILNLAISDVEEERTFYFHNEHRGRSSLLHPDERHFRVIAHRDRFCNDMISYKVKCLRLETVLRDRPKVGLLTIDAEDMDTRIVKDLIASDIRPCIVMSEGRNKEAVKEQQKIMRREYNLVSYDEGGGLYASFTGELVMNDCIISRNIAGYDGGGVYASVTNLIMNNCVISDNNGFDTAGGLELSGDGVLTNCLITGNGCGDIAGGIYLSSGQLILNNCTIADNRAGDSGGGFYCSTGTAAATANNTIFWNNSASIEADEIYHDCAFTLLNSCYADTTGDIAGAGTLTPTSCVTTDPLFVAGPSGAYYLSQVAATQASDSPCLDAGSDTAVNLGVDDKTTRTDAVTDAGQADIGYHYKP